MLSITMFGLAFASLSSAQITASLYIPGADKMPLFASRIAVHSSTTTYAVSCAPGTDGSDCGIGGGILLTQGPSTAAWTTSQIDVSAGTTVTRFDGGINCSLDGTISAVCTGGFTGVDANDSGPKTSTFTEDITQQVATLGSVSLYWTGSASRANTASPTASQTSPDSGVQQTSLPSGAQQSSSVKSSSTGTGGMAMATGNAWAVGGAAAMAVVAIL